MRSLSSYYIRLDYGEGCIRELQPTTPLGSVHILLYLLTV
uniref:Uncharacterized protein n=1 Tax=Zea mays TaxID=4577 RepID=B4FD99_MAIZE|nr:unknown [Zea mays]